MASQNYFQEEKLLTFNEFWKFCYDYFKELHDFRNSCLSQKDGVTV